MSVAPCALCRTTDGHLSARATLRPRRTHGLCSRCYLRVRKRCLVHGLDWEAALDADRGPRRMSYRQAAPVPVLWATGGFREYWERGE